MSRIADYAYNIGPHDVYVVGNQPRIISDKKRSFQQALKLGALEGKIAQLIVARDSKTTGFQLVVVDSFDQRTHADGVVIRQKQAAGIIQTADCGALILYDAKSGHCSISHAGRPAITPGRHCGDCHIVSHAVNQLVGSGGDASQIWALMVGNICGGHFSHSQPGAEKYVKPFRKYPAEVFTDAETGSLDIFEVVKHQLQHRGVPEANIRHEGPCTYESDILASYRRDRTVLRNTIILVAR